MRITSLFLAAGFATLLCMGLFGSKGFLFGEIFLASYSIWVLFDPRVSIWTKFPRDLNGYFLRQKFPKTQGTVHI